MTFDPCGPLFMVNSHKENDNIIVYLLIHILYFMGYSSSDIAKYVLYAMIFSGKWNFSDACRVDPLSNWCQVNRSLLCHPIIISVTTIPLSDNKFPSLTIWTCSEARRLSTDRVFDITKLAKFTWKNILRYLLHFIVPEVYSVHYISMFRSLKYIPSQVFHEFIAYLIQFTSCVDSMYVYLDTEYCKRCSLISNCSILKFSFSTAAVKYAQWGGTNFHQFIPY